MKITNFNKYLGIVEIPSYIRVGGIFMYSNKFEFPNDSPKEELVNRLIKGGLTQEEAEFLLTCYLIERIEKHLTKSSHSFNLN